MIDIMRTVHGAYAPDTDRFGTRLETFFIGLCVALGDIEDKPLTVTKIAVYMSVPRTTVIRRKQPSNCLDAFAMPLKVARQSTRASRRCTSGECHHPAVVSTLQCRPVSDR
jgi:hypothetical protein